MMPYASTVLFGYFEIVLDGKIKFPNKFYVNIFTRKSQIKAIVLALIKSAHCCNLFANLDDLSINIKYNPAPQLV